VRLSPHFIEHEFRCRHCGRVKVSPTLVARLEALRAIVGRPCVILSAYRCPEHNARVGGAPASQHLLGTAADLPQGYATVRQATSAGFTGIGHRGDWAVHVDVRPKRARWTY
jgi:uncharacterized protein YcbK (DUF882 family)